MIDSDSPCLTRCKIKRLFGPKDLPNSGPGVGESGVGIKFIEVVGVLIGVRVGDGDDVEVKVAGCVMLGMKAGGFVFVIATVFVPVMIYLSAKLEEINSLVETGLYKVEPLIE
jgi:hypothetical protein